MSARGYWAAFAVGLAAGAVVALLYAPQSGAKTRKKLGRAYDDAGDYLEDAGDYLKDQAERLAKQSKKLYAQGKEGLEDAYEATSSAASDALASVKDKASDSFGTVQDKASQFADNAASYGKKVRSMV